MFNSLMSWARRAMESGSEFNSPSHRTLQKRLNEVFPSSLYGGKVKSKLFSAEELELDHSLTLFYFDPLELISAKLRDPLFMKDFVCFPRSREPHVASESTTKSPRPNGSKLPSITLPLH